MTFIESFNKILDEHNINNSNDLYIYGLGTTGRLLSELCEYSGIDLSGIIVGKGYKNAETFSGYPICYVDDIKENGYILYTVKCTVPDELLGYKNIIDVSSVSFYWQLLNYWYDEFFKRNADRIIFQNDLMIWDKLKLINPKSIAQDEWDSFLQEAGDMLVPYFFDDYKRIDEGTYSYHNVVIKEGDVVVDAGAHIGMFSAFAAYMGAEKVYSFEPMRSNYKYLQRQALEYPQIIPVNKALDVESRDMYISIDGSSSSMYLENDAPNKELISCYTLDEYAENNNLDRIDFIKADIEGAECNMLRGATRVLREYAPKLAICTYHRPTDKEDITKIIKEANPKYKIEYKWKKLFATVN